MTKDDEGLVVLLAKSTATAQLPGDLIDKVLAHVEREREVAWSKGWLERDAERANSKAGWTKIIHEAAWRAGAEAEKALVIKEIESAGARRGLRWIHREELLQAVRALTPPKQEDAG